jgi:glutamate-1-semialdehyde 2,1-aminomutase
MKSISIFERAKKVIPGGVNSPVRAFGAVGGNPPFIKWGCGSRIYDEDGNEYIDLFMSWGPLILGHGRKEVIQKLSEAVLNGTSFGAPTELEVLLAEEIVNSLPSIEMVRFVNSGTEAVMSAVRLARAFTKRKFIVKFEGCYHGHSDSMLVSAGSGVLTFGIPSSPGVPEEIAGLTLVLPYNSKDMVKDLFSKRGEEIACVIVEPVAGNMGVILPEENFLETLRDETKKYGALLIFDEVITGFRISEGGAQEVFKIKPDLTCLGKIIGGGLPVGAYGGRREIMEMVSPSGPVYQAGTLSGNPLAMTAGLETIRILKKERPYKVLEEKTEKLSEEISKILRKKGIHHTINQIGSMLTIFFTGQKVKDLSSAKTSDTQIFSRFFHSLLKKGIYLPPSQFEAIFLSTAHTNEDLEKIVMAVEATAREI